MALLARYSYKETCMVCEEKKDTGIHIFNQLICESCERKLLDTDPNDEQYRYYLDKLNKLKITVKEGV